MLSTLILKSIHRVNELSNYMAKTKTMRMVYSDTGIVPPLIYALLTSSREVVIGAVTVDSMLISSMVQTLEDPIQDSIGYTQLVLTATFFAGIFQVAFGLFRSVLYMISYSLNSPIVAAYYCMAKES